jgi:SAM-dependent methyltransferase
MLPDLPGKLNYPDILAPQRYNIAQDTLSKAEGLLTVEEKLVLDLGCGLGGMVRYIAEQDVRCVVSVEISSKRAYAAHTYLQKHVPEQAYVVIGDAASLPFRNDVFDVIISTDTWEHLRHPNSAIQECERTLCNSGYLFIQALPYYSPWGLHAWDWLPIPWIQVLLPRKSLFKLIHWIEQRLCLNAQRIPETRIDWRFPDDPAHAQRLTVSAFERSFQQSALQVEHIELVPILVHIKFVAWLTRLLCRLPIIRKLAVGLIIATFSKP